MSCRETRLAFTVIVAFVLMSFPAMVWAKVGEMTLKELVAASDLIVVAKVSNDEQGPAHLNRLDEAMPPLKVATAQVIETWKGSPVREVRYVASPSWACDTSGAEKGERVVLFLIRRKDSVFMSIVHAGRGRMPLREVKAKLYAALRDEVILEKGTPTISEEKTSQFYLPATEPGKPATAVTFTYSVTSIELGVLRGLVRPTTPEK
jgi:hypothetical protein